MTPVEVVLEMRGPVMVVSLAGELDMASAPLVEEALGRAEAERPEVMVIDLRALSFLDSSGLRVLLHAHQRASQAGRRVALVRGPIEVQRVFTIALPDGRLTFVDSPEEA